MIELQPVSVPKAADVLAANLREQILTGRLSEGVSLPNERELSERAALSRTSVREALRILEGEGLIATRAGRNGGSVVVKPSSAAVERSIGIFIRGQQIRDQAVLEVREAIEPQAARLAAMHHEPADWVGLVSTHERLQQAGDDIPAFLQANLDWHISVVRASRNELLMAFISAISQSVYQATDVEGFNSPDVRLAVAMAHQRVMDAIAQRDGESAARRMARHVGAYVTSVSQRMDVQAKPQAMATVTPIRANRPPTKLVAVSAPGPQETT